MMRNKRLGLVALGLLAVIDLVLVFLAVRPTTVTRTSGQPIPSTSTAVAKPNAAGAAGATPAATAAAKPAPSTAPAQQQRSIALTDGGALMAAPGTCAAGGAAVFTSTDGGATWTPVDPPAGVVPRVSVISATSGFAIASDVTCAEPRLVRTDGSLSSWTDGVEPADTWFLTPQVPAQVNGPAGRKPSPCGAQVTLGLVPTATPTAVALCADGFTQVTADGGASWERTGQLAGARAIGGDPAGELIALSVAAGCQGLAVSVSADQGGQWEQTGCLTGANTTGPTGVGVSGTTVIAVDGAGKSFTSTDSGRQFTGG